MAYTPKMQSFNHVILFLFALMCPFCCMVHARYVTYHTHTVTYPITCDKPYLLATLQMGFHLNNPHTYIDTVIIFIVRILLYVFTPVSPPLVNHNVDFTIFISMPQNLLSYPFINVHVFMQTESDDDGNGSGVEGSGTCGGNGGNGGCRGNGNNDGGRCFCGSESECGGPRNKLIEHM